jgi:hypothetical protein
VLKRQVYESLRERIKRPSPIIILIKYYTTIIRDDSVLLKRSNKNKNINYIKFDFYIKKMFVLKIKVFTRENNSYKMIHRRQLVHVYIIILIFSTSLMRQGVKAIA